MIHSPLSCPRAPRALAASALLAVGAIVVCAAPLAAQAPASPSASPSAQFDDSSGATRPRVPRSWTSDRRDFAVGDIITVIVDEYTAASANKGNVATDEKRRSMDVGAELPSGGGKGVSIDSRNDGSSRQRGEATRANRFRGEISVRVVSVSKEGNLEIKGSKLVDIDENKQTMTLSGWVRPQDISARDYIESSRIADAQLVYEAKGNLGKPRGGILTRVLGVIWP
jgi:flagellar L-ring protein precursor FlgH